MALKKPLLSVAEYLELEAESPVKYEYVGGEVFALAGTTDRHNQLALNLVVKLWDAARKVGCRVYASDVKVRTPNDAHYYPDVMVLCEDDSNPLVKTKPCLIVEVLSPSTEVVDRREKLFAYQGLASLQAYVLVASETQRVERYYRAPQGWMYERAADEVAFPCPGVTLSLAEIYEGLE